MPIKTFFSSKQQHLYLFGFLSSSYRSSREVIKVAPKRGKGKRLIVKIYTCLLFWLLAIWQIMFNILNCCLLQSFSCVQMSKRCDCLKQIRKSELAKLFSNKKRVWLFRGVSLQNKRVVVAALRKIPSKMNKWRHSTNIFSKKDP